MTTDTRHTVSKAQRVALEIASRGQPQLKPNGSTVRSLLARGLLHDSSEPPFYHKLTRAGRDALSDEDVAK